MEDPSSLKLWVKVLHQAPISELMKTTQGYEIVKLMMSKLWTDSTTSYTRIQERQKLFLKINKQNS